MAGFALPLYVCMGVRWTWGFCLQALAMLVVAVLGIMFQPAAFFCAWLGWAMFVLTIIVPRTILSRLERNLNLLAAEAARAEARKLRWFFWGAPGRFWLDMTEVMCAYINGDRQAAEELIQSWQGFPMPRGARESLTAYLLSGKVLLRDWPAILEEFLPLRQQGCARIPQGVAIAASRAYAELGMISDSLACLELANLKAARVGYQALNLVFLPFFALSGACSDSRRLLSDLANGREALPEYARLYWLGRCMAVGGATNQARQLLAEAWQRAPEHASAWRGRIEYQLASLSGTQNLAPAPDWSCQIGKGMALLEQARMVLDIVSPRQTRPAVIALVLLIASAYLVSHSYAYLPSALTLSLSLSCFQLGVLDPQLVKAGEYWRLVSYLFLHSHLSHLVLNLVGLWWFGRLAENLFGTGRFLLIYFACGILSGLTHILLSPAMLAVGASGALMGVFGAATAGIFRLKYVLPESIRKTEVAWMLGLAVLQVLLDQVVPHVAVFAHLGGLVAGLVLGLVVPTRKQRSYSLSLS